MTMPHLMNCGHSDDGHCLDCVKAAGEERESLRAQLATAQAELALVTAEMDGAVYADIRREREEQDRRFGGPIHDDSHLPCDWLAFLKKHVAQAACATPTDYRYQLVRVAALAVAAAESFDRHARSHPTLEGKP